MGDYSKQMSQHSGLAPPTQSPLKLPVVLVTGCSSGIGLALAEQLFSESQYRVVITSRAGSLAILKERFTESERFLIRPLDITSLEQVRHIVAEVEQDWGGVDILINNAGISFRSMVEDMTAHDENLQMQTNYLGPMNLVRYVLPSMRRKQCGRIINVSSVSGMMAMPTMSSYSASKFALEGASESLWYEMRPWNIQVSLIQPGFINSESYKRVYYSSKFMLKQENSPYYHVYQSMARFVERMMNYSRSTPDDIARIIVKTMKRKKAPLRVAATRDAYIFYYLRRWVPRRIYHRLLYAFLPGVRHWRDNEVRRQAHLDN